MALRSRLPGRVIPSSRWPSSCSAVSRRPQCYLTRGRSLLPLYLCSMFLFFYSFSSSFHGAFMQPHKPQRRPLCYLTYCYPVTLRCTKLGCETRKKKKRNKTDGNVPQHCSLPASSRNYRRRSCYEWALSTVIYYGDCVVCVNGT